MKIKKILKKVKSQIFGCKTETFEGSADYWESRYKKGGNSGAGSYDHLAEYKAKFLNQYVKEKGISTVIEFGSGDGNQLKMAEYPRYIGVDVSETCISACRKNFGSDDGKKFVLLGDYLGEKAELSMSLDVIYHLVETAVFEEYMEVLFTAATRFVIVFASNYNSVEGETAVHVRHRKFSDWIEKNRPQAELLLHEENPYPYNKEAQEGSFADFYVYKVN